MQKAVKNIPLEILINSLIEVYNDGADFIDLLLIEEKERDILRIMVSPPYEEMNNDITFKDLIV